MNSRIDIILLTFFIMNQTWQVIKITMRYKKEWFSQKIWSILTFTSAAMISSVELLKVLDILPAISSIKLQSTFLGLFSFCLLAIFSLGIINNVTQKKIKTLWRLPIIGLLIGHYLTLSEVMIVAILVEVIVTIILTIKSNDYIFYFKANLKSFVLLLLLVLLWYFNLTTSAVLIITFFIYYYFKVILINTATLSYWIKYISPKEG